MNMQGIIFEKQMTLWVGGDCMRDQGRSKKFFSNNNRKKTTRYEQMFLMSYVVMMLIPLIGSIVGVYYATSTIKQDASLYQDAILNQSKSVNDSIFKQMRNSINVVAANTRAHSLANKNDWQAEEMFEILELRNELSDLQLESDYLESVGIYFYDNGDLITNKTRYVKHLAIDYYWRQYGTDLKTLVSAMENLEGYIVLTGISDNYLVFYRNIYSIQQKKEVAVVYGIISWSTIASANADFTMIEDTGILLINSENLFIGNTNSNINVDHITYEFLTDEEDEIRFIKLNESTYFIGSSKSDILDIYYSIYIPQKLFSKNLSGFIYVVAVQMIICIVAGLFLAWYFTKKNYRPIERMLNLINAKKKRSTDEDNIESYQKLEHVLIDFVSDNEALEKKLYSKEQKEVESIFTGFLKGNYQYEGWINDFAEQYPPLKEMGTYRLVLFAFRNIENSVFLNEQGANLESWSLLFFSIKNVIKEALDDIEKAAKNEMCMEIDGMVVYFICDSSEQLKDRYIPKIKHCINFFRDAFALNADVSISGEHQTYIEIAQAYEEALMALGYKRFWDKEIKEIALYEKGAFQEPQNRRKSLGDKKRRLTNALTGGNYKEASYILDDILENCFQRDVHYFSYNQCQAISIVTMLWDNLDYLDLLHDTEMKENLGERIIKAKTQIDLSKEIRAVFDEVVSIQEKKQREEPERIEQVKSYIIQNYQNPELNIAHVAEQYSMSVSYIGSWFKQMTGVSMLDYIHTKRLEVCKELLRQGMTIKDCTILTGYADTKTLQRVFKRYEGITPGQYKKQYKVTVTDKQ